jgi:hypothetical protein
LKFGNFLSKEFEFKDICSDPFSNGILLAELFGLLEKLTILKINKEPRTIAESRENVSKVLNVIKQKRKDFPLRLLSK